MPYDYDLEQELEDLYPDIKAWDKLYVFVATVFNVSGVGLLALVVILYMFD